MKRTLFPFVHPADRMLAPLTHGDQARPSCPRTRLWSVGLALVLALALAGQGRAATDLVVPLTQGWNLITLPLVFTGEGAGTLLTQAGITETWLWTNGAWQPVAADELMLAGKGVWVKSPASGTLAISGEQMAMPYAWSMGWNLTGVTGSADTTVAAAVQFALLMDNDQYSPEAKVISVWKWQNNGWAVNLPAAADKGAEYANDNGLAFFTDLKQFQGFWVQVGLAGTTPALPPALPGSSTTTVATTTSTASTTSTTGSSSTTVSTTTTTTLPAFTIPLTQGWNLVGSRTPIIKTDQTFADQGQFVSVWKWLDSGWAVFLAGEELPGTYAQGKGFSPLTAIDPGEGFWVNAVKDGQLSLQGETAVATELSVVQGWNLKCLLSPNQVSATALFVPPTPAISVWAWQGETWAVLLPGEAKAGEYADSKGFSPLATLKPGQGFWVNAAAGGTIPLPTPPPDLGSIHYTADTGLQANTTYAHDGNPAVVTVTDGQGYIWTLTIPYGALPWPEKVTLTPFASLDTTGSVTKATSGVRLEPDGLYFVQPATLSVQPPSGVQAAGLIFSLNHDGTGVQFAPTATGTGAVSAQIDHFSAAAYDPSQDGMDFYTKQAEEEYAWAVKEAQAFLAQGAPSPPSPPALCPYCRGTEANQDHGEYYEYEHAFWEPYQDIEQVLLSAARTLDLLGSSVDTSGGKALAKQIAELAWKSIVDEGKKYEQESPPERLMVVVPVALAVARQVQLLGGEATTETVIPWCKTIRDYYFDQLQTQHDYQAWPLLISLGRNYELVGGADDGFVDKLIAALTFEVKWENTFTLGQAQVTQEADLKELGLKLEKGWWWGDITLNYTGGYFISQEHPLIMPLSLTTELTMWNWDPCVTKTVDVVLWGAFGSSEPYGGLTSPQAVAVGASMNAYSARVVQGNPAGFMFTVPLSNKNVTLGDQEFSGSGAGGNAQAQSHITIIHTPK